MALPDASPKLFYHSPTALSRGRQRRSSGRKSFTAAVLPASIESPRTLCPKDSDAFSYQPSHLPAWYIPQELWERLPHHLQPTLTAMQHSGAAVLTGFERLEKHSGALDNHFPEGNAHEDEMLAQLDDSFSSLPSLPPALTRLDSSVSSSAIFSSPSSGSASPSSISASQITSPISPICLTPADTKSPPAKISRERSFSTPLEPHNAYYATELSQLRTESLPRLRHAARKVDAEWNEVKRSGALKPSDVMDFETWWNDKKTTVLSLNEKGRRLSEANGLASTGLGWTAP